MEQTDGALFDFDDMEIDVAIGVFGTLDLLSRITGGPASRVIVVVAGQFMKDFLRLSSV